MRRWIGFWLCLGALLWPAMAWAQQPVTLTVEQAGFDSNGASGQWVPLTIHLTNTGADTRGVVRITVQPFVRQDISVELPGGGDKLIKTSVQLYPNAQQLQAEFIEEGASNAAPNASSRVQVQMQERLGLLFGGARADLADLRTRGKPLTVVSGLAADTLPTQDGSLYGVGLIGLSDTPVSAEQAALLERWVGAGGILIIQAGPSTSQFPETLAALAPATIAQPGVQSVQLPDFKEPTQPVRLLTPKAGAETVVADNQGRPVIVRKAYGQGWVLVSGLDFGRQFTSASARGAGVWETVIPPRSGQVAFPEMASWMVNQRLNLPGSGTIALLLLLYVILVGPVNYLVLKRLDRLELAWFTLPATILVMLGVLFVLAQDLRGGSLDASVRTIVQAPLGAQQGRFISIASVSPGRRTTLNLDPPAGIMLGSVSGENGERMQLSLRQTEAQWQLADQTINVGEVLNMSLAGALPVPYQGTLTYATASNTGTFVNTGPAIEHAYVVYNGEVVQLLGSVAPGASIDLDQDFANQTTSFWPDLDDSDSTVLSQQFSTMQNDSALPGTPFLLIVDHERRVPLNQAGSPLPTSDLNIYLLSGEGR